MSCLLSRSWKEVCGCGVEMFAENNWAETRVLVRSGKRGAGSSEKCMSHKTSPFHSDEGIHGARCL